MAGSMGSVVGEKIARTIELALAERRAVVIVTASGGARMQEGILSLMQMAKTSALLATLKEERLPFVSILTDPSTAGVMASYASLGDVIFAEPGALIGFAGPRVIQDTIGEELPPGFQRSDFVLEHGMVDAVVHRKDMRATVGRVLGLFWQSTDGFKLAPALYRP
jgi:acetyl-CoA carboxylase carboxyl transferase subunit beta